MFGGNRSIGINFLVIFLRCWKPGFGAAYFISGLFRIVYASRSEYLLAITRPSAVLRLPFFKTRVEDGFFCKNLKAARQCRRLFCLKQFQNVCLLSFFFFDDWRWHNVWNFLLEVTRHLQHTFFKAVAGFVLKVLLNILSKLSMIRTERPLEIYSLALLPPEPIEFPPLALPESSF